MFVYQRRVWVVSRGWICWRSEKSLELYWDDMDWVSVFFFGENMCW